MRLVGAWTRTSRSVFHGDHRGASASEPRVRYRKPKDGERGTNSTVRNLLAQM
jgi:hypothetical protein